MKERLVDSPRKYDAVVIVASAGGIQALSTVLSALPSEFPIPLFIVQHRRSDWPSLLVEVLQRSTRLGVRTAKEGIRPSGGCVYLAPPDRHLLITKFRRLTLRNGRRVRHLLSAGDPLFASAAKVYGAGLIAVVLTGQDSDGANGVVDVKRAGGTVLVQDQKTAVFFSMPKAAIETGCVDAVLPIRKIGPELVAMVNGA